MRVFRAAYQIMDYVINHQIPFFIAVKNTNKKFRLTEEEKKNAFIISLNAFRHYFLFNEVRKKYPDSINSQLISVVTDIVLANNLYAKKIDNAEMINYAQTFIFENISSFDKKAFEEFILWCESTSTLLSENINQESVEYLSYRYNFPTWIIDMWQKQFSPAITLSILKNMIRPNVTYLKINELLINPDIVLSTPGFSVTDCKNIYTYDGSCPLLKLDLYHEQKIYSCIPLLSMIIDELNFDHFSKACLYIHDYYPLTIELANRFTNLINLDIVTTKKLTASKIKKDLNLMEMPNASLFELDGPSFITCLSTKVDLFIVMPDSTNFNSIKKTPEWFLSIEQEDLDSLIQKQKEALSNADTYLNKNGLLLYVVPTISNKEGHQQIQEFLNRHSYSLIKEKQSFPFEQYNHALYYALLRKNND